MGWESRANEVITARARRRIEELKVRCQLGHLSAEDIRFLTEECGPGLRAYVGYEPKVGLFRPKVTLR